MAVRVRAASRPGNQQLEKLHAALKVCGSENGDPLAVSRDQFVAIAAHELPNEFGGEKGRKLASRLYSCFDSEAPVRDRARYDCLVGGLVFANRPDVYKFLGLVDTKGTGSDAAGAAGVDEDPTGGRFPSLLPVLRAVFDLFSGDGGVPVTAPKEGCVSGDDLRALVTLCSLSEDDALVLELLWRETSKTNGAFAVPPRDRRRILRWGTVLEGLGAGELMAELDRQVLGYQAAVQRALADLKDGEEAKMRRGARSS